MEDLDMFDGVFSDFYSAKLRLCKATVVKKAPPAADSACSTGRVAKFLATNALVLGPKA